MARRSSKLFLGTTLTALVATMILLIAGQAFAQTISIECAAFEDTQAKANGGKYQGTSLSKGTCKLKDKLKYPGLSKVIKSDTFLAASFTNDSSGDGGLGIAFGWGSDVDNVQISGLTGSPSIQSEASYTIHTFGGVVDTNAFSANVSFRYENTNYQFTMARNAGEQAIQAFTITGTAIMGPSVVLSTETDPVSGPFTVTATFSEDVTGFELGDIVVGNGAASNFKQVTASVYTFDVTPSSVGDVTVDVAAGAAENLSDTDSLKAEQLKVTGTETDAEPPVITFESSPAYAKNRSPIFVDILFGSNVSELDEADVTIENAEITQFQKRDRPDNAWKVRLVPIDKQVSENIDIVLGVKANAVIAENGAYNESAELVILYDTERPEITLSGVPEYVRTTDPFSFDVVFSEPVDGFDADDLSISAYDESNSLLSNAVQGEIAPSSDDRTFRVTLNPSGFASPPLAEGKIQFAIAADAAKDSVGSPSKELAPIFIYYDTVAPDVVLSTEVISPVSGIFAVTATFTDGVTGFDVGDVSIQNGSIANFQTVSGSVFTFDVTPGADGSVKIDIPAGVAEDSAGNVNNAASQLSVTTDGTAPTVVITGPNSVVPKAFTVTFTFSEPVTGFDETDITLANGGLIDGTFAGDDDIYTVKVEPVLGTTVTVSVAADAAEDMAGNGNLAADPFEVASGSPAAEFAAHKDEIRSAIVDETHRLLQSKLAANRRMSRNALSRFVTHQKQPEDGDAGPFGSNDIDFNMQIMPYFDDSSFGTRGNFFQQSSNPEGTGRSLLFGDFYLQRDHDGSLTATLHGKLAWEQNVSDSTMLGYYVGIDLGRSKIVGSFDGNQNNYGLSIGAYGVTQLQENLFADGFLSISLGNNDLAMGNGTLDLESAYLTSTMTLGGALTGVIEGAGFEIWPEIAFSYGRTHIGDVDFVGWAYGMSDDSLSLDAGDVSVATISIQPQLRLPVDGKSIKDSNALFSFAPHLTCEHIQTTETNNSCGGGAELGFSTMSEDGMGQFNTSIMMEQVGNTKRAGLELALDLRF